jgi:hypothetical protein
MSVSIELAQCFTHKHSHASFVISDIEYRFYRFLILQLQLILAYASVACGSLVVRHCLYSSSPMLLSMPFQVATLMLDIP